MHTRDLPILVVDPHAESRAHLLHLLRDLGMRNLAQASDGAQAVVWANRNPGRALVLCDLDMPKLDAMGFIRVLSELRSSIALAISSAHQPDLLRAVRLLAQNLGVNLVSIIGRPAQHAEVAGVINSVRVQGLGVAAPVAANDLLTVEELRTALDNGWLAPFFQPKLRLTDQRIIGCESLVRIVHPQRGVLLPGRFLPAMIEAGLEFDVAAHVFDGAAHLLERLADADPEFRIAINVSVPLLESAASCVHLLELLEVHGVPLARLVIEVTEDAAAVRAASAVENLARLRMRGVHLSIDDFGTGYSSLDQLQRLPFSELKLDASFVRAATVDADARTMVEATLLMARRLGLTTVAEGVETAEHAELMRELGCQVGQGFLFARPMPADQFCRWLALNAARAA